MDDRSGWQVKNQNRYKQELIWWKVSTKTIIKHIFIRININFMQSRGFLLSLWMSMLLSLCPNIDDSVQSIHAVVNRFRNTKLISSVLEWKLKVMFCISSASKLETHFLSFVVFGCANFQEQVANLFFVKSAKKLLLLIHVLCNVNSVRQVIYPLT